MKVTIVGFGRSGMSAAKLAESLGYEIFVSEKRNISLPYPGETGEHTEKILEGEVIVVSPGIEEFELLKRAREIGKEVVDELEFAYRYLRGKVVAVTGTNGKTTTCGMLYEILKSAGKNVFLGGNIYPGVPLSEIALKTTGGSITVVEVSSFQLERISMFKPDVGVVMNITPDHMDRYKDFDEYVQAKKRMFMNSEEEDIAILNLDDEILRKWKLKPETLYFSVKERADVFVGSGCVKTKSGDCLFYREDIKLIGDFFVEDGMASALAALSLGIPHEAIKKGLKHFKGIPHRMEIVKEEPLIVNNSMCTNPVAFRNCIASMEGALVFVGGRLKNLDPEELVDASIKYAGFVVLFGESKNILSDLFEKKGYKDYYVSKSLEDGVKIAREKGFKKILFSPGGSSLDMFRNFAERGERFKELIKEYFDGKG